MRTQAQVAPNKTRIAVSIGSETYLQLCQHAENQRRLGEYVDQAIREKVERDQPNTA